MTKEEIVNLANRCSRKIWETCMEEPGFSTNDCPEGANGLSDIVLNVILKEFPAIKECSSLPSDLDEAAEEYRDTEVCTDSDYIDDDGDSLYRSFALREAFKSGAEWMAHQGQTLDSFIWMDEDDKLFIEAFVDENKFKMADNVIIQVRKKQ